MEASDMLDSYEQDLDFEKLKISLENASKEASMEMFSCLQRFASIVAYKLQIPF